MGEQNSGNGDCRGSSDPDLGRDDGHARRRNHRASRRRALDHLGRDRLGERAQDFKDVGIKLNSSDLDSSANSIALLSQNQLDVIEGGIAAGYFNGLEKELPITMVMDRVSTPIGHNLMCGRT